MQKNLNKYRDECRSIKPCQWSRTGGHFVFRTGKSGYSSDPVTATRRV
ncbi:hypothetical protein LT85_4284 [Collimonas arenae]|uniref:Uncharacterized protein n=1 Tax=Collimonas arenae TaxID=279058 RepID=A0A0A1FKK6_9BURK|nr:hypothetical protein LT85_4284 [Collimonas arenae]